MERTMKDFMRSVLKLSVAREHRAHPINKRDLPFIRRNSHSAALKWHCQLCSSEQRALGQSPQLLGSKPPCSWVKPPRLRTTCASGCGRVRGARASPTGDKRLCVRARNSRSRASSSLHPQCPDEERCAVALLLACAATICLRICRSPMR
jgi:hypothetical protein